MAKGDSNKPILGGIHICRPKPLMVRRGKGGAEQGFRLMSDLHIGASHVDYKLIQHEIAEAVEQSDRVLINGDLLDLILPKDSKRYDPSALHPRVSNRSDTINAAVEWAVELLSPAAHLIDLLAIGNHESSVQKWHSVDPMLLVLYELEKINIANKAEHTIHYGGFTGFVDYRIRFMQEEEKESRPKKKGDHNEWWTNGGRRWVVYYHHGSGQAAPVTKGLIDFNRKDTFIDADVIWMGHKHNRLNVHVEKLSCPLTGDRITVKDVRHIMTGGYFKTYENQTQESVRKHGRRSNYAADAGMAPQGKGGCRVLVRMCLRGTEQLKVQVVQ